jgi:hypothetical protein
MSADKMSLLKVLLNPVYLLLPEVLYKQILTPLNSHVDRIYIREISFINC